MSRILKNWIEVKLGCVCNIISGKNQKAVLNPEGKYPIYGSGGKFGMADDYLCEAGTTIIGRKGTINSPIYVNEKFWNVDTAFGISPMEIVLPKLLFFFCVRFNFHKLDKSTTIPSLAKRDIQSIPFCLPPLPEQRAIVAKIEELFSELDNGITNLKSAQQKLEIYRQAVLKKAFEGELTKAWREKQDLVPWEEISLGEIIESIDAGKSFRCDERPPKKEEYGILKVSAVTWGRFLEEESKTVTDINKINEKYLVKEGDFLFSRANTIELVGNAVIIHKVTKNLMLSDRTLRISFKENTDPYFVLYFLRCRNGRNQIESLSTGNQASMRNIGQQRIKQILIPYPSCKEQHQIVQEIESRLSVCDELAQTIEDNLQKAEALQQSILKKAFEGRLLTEQELQACQREPDWEPAEKLLQRIQHKKGIATTGNLFET